MQNSKDSLINKFDKADLKEIINNNSYHSPDVSETDEEAGKNKIVTYDLQWRSNTVSVLVCLIINRHMLII